MAQTTIDTITIPGADTLIARGTTEPRYTQAHRGPYFAYPERACWVDWAIYERADGSRYKVQSSNSRWAGTFAYGDEEISDDLSRPGHEFFVGESHMLYRSDNWGAVDEACLRIPRDGAPTIAIVRRYGKGAVETFATAEEARARHAELAEEGWTTDRSGRAPLKTSQQD
jgi:hypothetical protein